MNGTLHIDSHALMREIARYLAAVDAFRVEQCEPTWLPEPTQPRLVGRRLRDAREPVTH